MKSARALLVVLSSLVVSPLLHAGLTPGHFILQDLDGQARGESWMSISTGTFNEKPVTVVEILRERKIPRFFGSDKISQKDLAYIDDAGLAYFKRNTLEKGEATVIEGRRENGMITMWVTKGEKRLSAGVPLSSMDMSEFEMELPRSKFNGMKLNEGRRAQVLFVDSLSVKTAVRNVNERKTVPWGSDYLCHQHECGRQRRDLLV